MLSVIGAALRWLASSRLGQALAGLAALLGVMAYRERKAAQRGAQGVIEKGRKDEAERVERGRQAVRDGRGADPDQRVRDNDGDW